MDPATSNLELVQTLPVGAILIGLAGGLAIFLFGMELMTAALKSISGPRMKNVLAELTTNRFKAATAGAFVTAVIQSSSVTTVLVVGFITAGLMTLAQAIGIIMGANIGTTVTAQIIAFDVTQYALVMVAAGFFLMFSAKRERWKQIGTMVMGLGLIFFGMEMMSEATHPLRTYEPFILLMQQLNSPLPAILISAAFTALVQSSSATTGVVIVLASQGFITLETGIALIFGANIGTCITALFASVGKPRAAVQAAMVHVFFNVAGVIIWFGFIDQLADLTRTISPAAEGLVGSARLAADTPRQIANAHTIFNVSNTFIFIWFTVPIAWMMERLIPEKPVPESVVLQPKYLDENLLETPELALDRVRLEIGRMGISALQMVWQSIPNVIRGSEQDLDELVAMDHDVDNLHAAIIGYLGHLSQRHLTDAQVELHHDYLSVATYIENIGDMVETNLVEAGQERILNDVVISPVTADEISALHQKVCWAVEMALEAVDRNSPVTAQIVIDAKAEINRLAEAVDAHLARRLVADEDNRLQTYRIETDMVENLRRIYYFAKRIAKAIAEQDTVREDAPLPTAEQEVVHQYANESVLVDVTASDFEAGANGYVQTEELHPSQE
jgi:phosphate:Na+ symporter